MLAAMWGGEEAYGLQKIEEMRKHKIIWPFPAMVGRRKKSSPPSGACDLTNQLSIFFIYVVDDKGLVYYIGLFCILFTDRFAWVFQPSRVFGGFALHLAEYI